MSSASDIFPPATKSGGQESAPRTRPNPVALEVPVNVTGARPSSEGGARDLFSEDTTTALVFKDGAVIRLSAVVAVGQLLFLTNRKSKEEVVCQVLCKRSFRPAVCYVELQFTEERPGFWDVAFPDGKTGGSELIGPEHVKAEGRTKDDPGTPEAPHSAEDVVQLKKKAETLEKKTAVEATAKAAEVRTVVAPKAKPELAPVNDPSPAAAKVAEEVTALLMPAAKDKKEAPRPVVAMTLPSQKSESKKPVEEAQDTTEDLLPKPELDFSKVPQSAVHVGDKAKRSGTGKLRVIGLSALLVLVATGGTWYGKWWQYLPLGKLVTAVAPAKAVKANPRGAMAGNRDARGQAARVAGNVGAAANGATGANAPRAAAGDAGTKEDKNAGTGTSAEENKNGEGIAGAGTEETKESAVVETAAGKAASKQNGGRSTAALGAAEPVASDGATTPAKLLKAANPTYPPEAMRNYITGDVKAELVVEATGRVSEVRVISGPKALRTAAVEALKQYQYAPGMQGGKAVASKVTVTVKFWFNP